MLVHAPLFASLNISSSSPHLSSSVHHPYIHKLGLTTRPYLAMTPTPSEIVAPLIRRFSNAKHTKNSLSSLSLSSSSQSSSQTATPSSSPPPNWLSSPTSLINNNLTALTDQIERRFEKNFNFFAAGVFLGAAVAGGLCAGMIGGAYFWFGWGNDGMGRGRRMIKMDSNDDDEERNKSN